MTGTGRTGDREGPLVEVAVDAPVATLTLSRPARRNPLSSLMIAALRTALADAASDPRVRVVVLGARGPAFCAGHDIAEMNGRDEAFFHELFSACAGLMTDIHDLPVPVIARVQGIATAAGCQLVAACDLAVAADEARFATPGVRIGLFCTTPMIEVARAVGPKRAMEMLLTGNPIDAATAQTWGLVNHVVPAADLDAAAAALAGRVAEASAATLRVGKRAFHALTGRPPAQAYPGAVETMACNAADPDAREGMAAFLEKRPPVWTGR